MRACRAASPSASLNSGTTIDRPTSAHARGRASVPVPSARLIGLGAIVQPFEPPPRGGPVYSATWVPCRAGGSLPPSAGGGGSPHPARRLGALRFDHVSDAWGVSLTRRV